MEDAKYLGILFENVEDIVIPVDRIFNFECGELMSMSTEKLKDFYWENTYRSDYISFDISYDDESELAYSHDDCSYPLGGFTDNPTSNNVEDRPNILGRLLNHSDIVAICFLPESDTLEELGEPIKMIYAPWGDSDYVNTCMSIKAEDGFIEIKIKE